MRPTELKVGHKANPQRLKELGYERLSSTQWVKDGRKVQILGKKVKRVIQQTKYKLIHRGGITDDDRRITKFPKPKTAVVPKKTKSQKRKQREKRRLFRRIGLIK